MKLSSAYQIMIKPSGSLCNLDCSYCFYLEKEKLYPSVKNWRMSEFALEHFVKQYIESQATNEILFAWQGGEPTLLGIDFFEKAIKFQKQYAAGKKIRNTIQTNGVLLNDDWSGFLKENNFLVGLSIDGSREIHDKYRVDKGGHPTFDKVMCGLNILQKYGVEYNTLTVVQKDNSYKALEVYNFLKGIGSKYHQYIPIVERVRKIKSNLELNLIKPDYNDEAELTPWSVEPLQYGIFLQTIFDEWVRKDVGNIFVQIFDVALEVWYGQKSSLCVFNETCGQALAIEHNGDLYSCDHYVYEENKLGNIFEKNINELVDSGKQIKFGLDKKLKLPQYCRNCEVKFICNGECPKHRFIKTPDGEEGLNYLCAGYKHFFTHINQYMNYMADQLRNKKPPANVMKWKYEAK